MEVKIQIENLAEKLNQDNLKKTVNAISFPRHGWYNYEALLLAAEFIEKRFKEYGYVVESDKFNYQGKQYRNITATLNGIHSNRDWLLIGAHYDSAIESPGADDNASGIAVMLEIARVITQTPMAKVIKFVAFTLEEPQVFDFKFIIGSRNFVKKMKKLGHKYTAIILESVGYFSEKKGSQNLPAFIKGPDVGNFIGVVGNKKSRYLLQLFEEAKIFVPSLNVITYKAPMNGWLSVETRFSDHAPFWDAGFQAVMITDTAMFRNPYYHTPSDTPEKLNFSFMMDISKLILSVLIIKAQRSS